MKIRILISILLIRTLTSCETVNTPPTPSAYSIPRIGDTTTIFMLDGKNSSDKECSYFALKYRWDTNADGIWDSEYSTKSSYTSRFNHTGYQKYILEVADDEGSTATYTDSVFILIKNIASDTLTDQRDGRRYRIVQIGNRWWMADNLKYGEPVDVQIPLTDNGRPEYLYFNNKENFSHYGGLYTWVEANLYPSNYVYRDICPPGWRIPSAAQWSEVLKKYSSPYDVLYYFGPNSVENLGVEMTGYYRYGDPDTPMKGQFKGDSINVRYWTSVYTELDSTRYFTGIHFTRDSSYFVQSIVHPVWIYHPRFPGFIIGYKTPEACYVRCVKE